MKSYFALTIILQTRIILVSSFDDSIEITFIKDFSSESKTCSQDHIKDHDYNKECKDYKECSSRTKSQLKNHQCISSYSKEKSIVWWNEFFNQSVNHTSIEFSQLSSHYINADDYFTYIVPNNNEAPCKDAFYYWEVYNPSLSTLRILINHFSVIFLITCRTVIC